MFLYWLPPRKKLDCQLLKITALPTACLPSQFALEISSTEIATRASLSDDYLSPSLPSPLVRDLPFSSFLQPNNHRFFCFIFVHLPNPESFWRGELDDALVLKKLVSWVFPAHVNWTLSFPPTPRPLYW